MNYFNIQDPADSYNKGEKYYKEHNYHKAFIKFKEAAAGDIMDAYFRLGYMYHEGLGIDQDSQQGVYWYTSFHENTVNGTPVAQYNIAQIYFYREGNISQGYNQALHWYKKAAENNILAAYNQLGYMYEHRFGVSKDYKQALQWYLKGASQENTRCQHNLGVLYRNGWGVEKDLRAGVSYSMYSLGLLYEEGGPGLPRDYNMEYKWHNKASKNGCTSAYYKLGYMCHKGLGGDQDFVRALNWYLESQRNLHDAISQYNAANIYYNGGRDMRPDYEQALHWYKEAAENNYTNAQNQIGHMYQHGLGVSKDYKQALQWYYQERAREVPPVSIISMYLTQMSWV